MLLFTSYLLFDVQPMPKAVELFFFSVGIVLLFVGSARASAARREWKRKADETKQKSYKMPVKIQIEVRLYTLAALTCWAVGSSSWLVRAVAGGLAVAMIIAVLYRNSLAAPDTPPFDAESMLHIPNQESISAPGKS